MKMGGAYVSDWKDIIAISANKFYPIGLKSDGSVVVAGNEYDISEWSDIVMISVDAYYPIGLKSDGTVIAAEYGQYGQSDVYAWTDIKLP